MISIIMQNSALGASLFEIKAKRPSQEDEIDWIEEIALMKDKDLALLGCYN